VLGRASGRRSRPWRTSVVRTFSAQSTVAVVADVGADPRRFTKQLANRRAGRLASMGHAASLGPTRPGPGHAHRVVKSKAVAVIGFPVVRVEL
jgi:hypothetical protein